MCFKDVLKIMITTSREHIKKKKEKGVISMYIATEKSATGFIHFQNLIECKLTDTFP